MTKLVITAVGAACAAWVLTAHPTASPSAAPHFTVLQPGQFREINQQLTVNVVFVGLEPGHGPRDIDETAFLSGLPHSYRSIDRTQRFYGIDSPTGNDFTYRYNIVYASASFENAFFSYLKRIAVPSPRTMFQDQYNQQVARSLTIGDNYRIDATSTEKWLAENAGPRLGVDTKQYTIFYVNWYGRADFRFHGYADPSEPDPDTGVNWAETDLFDSKDYTRFTGWGGTTPDDAESGLGSLHRVWFVDVSAGPAWDGDWNVDDADTTGDGNPDYRVPPIWEYGNTSGYRPFDNLSGDLGLITRFTAINLLFTASAIYPAALTPPNLPATIQLDLTLFQGDPGLDGLQRLHRAYILKKVSKLRPLNEFSTTLRQQPLDGEFQRAFECWINDTTCYPDRFGGWSFASLYVYLLDHKNELLTGGADHEIPIFLISSADSYWPPDRCQCSYTDDNYVDGTQSFIVENLSDFFGTRGYGFTEDTIHEVGHYLGLSHPHDGYDSEYDFDYDRRSIAVASLGQDSATVMSYSGLNLDYSQFNRDNMNRYLVAAYINQANAILPAILAHAHASLVTPLLITADEQARQSLRAYDSMEYLEALQRADRAYRSVVAAARALHIEVGPESWRTRSNWPGTGARRFGKAALPDYVTDHDHHHGRRSSR